MGGFFFWAQMGGHTNDSDAAYAYVSKDLGCEIGRIRL